MFTSGTDGVNSQQVTGPIVSYYAPSAGLGPILRGTGPDAALPTIPLARGGSVNTATGYQDNSVPLSPMAWLVLAGMFIVGLLGMRYVHWRG